MSDTPVQLPTPRLPAVVPVDDAGDDRLADYVRLRETSLRRSLESERGLFIAEGEKVIRRAVEAGYRPRSFLLAPRWLAGLADVLARWPEVPVYLVSEDLAEGEKVIRRAVEAGYRPRSFLLAPRWLAGLADVLARWPQVPVYLVSEDLAEEVTGFHVHRGALASLHREERHTVADLLSADRLLVCEDVVDHTNVGAVLRNAAGLGWDGVLLSPRAADPLYRRAVKVSMGAVFSLPWARLEDWHAALDQLHTAGFTTLALTLADDAVDLAAVAAELAARPVEEPAKVAVLLGTEGAGLSARWTSGARVRVRIPMSAGIDSLNVAAASAIACYALGPASSSSSSSSSRNFSRGETGQSSG